MNADDLRVRSVEAASPRERARRCVEAMIASASHRAESWKDLSLGLSFSTAVSITRSHSESPSMVSAEHRESACLRCSSVIFLRDLRDNAI